MLALLYLGGGRPSAPYWLLLAFHLPLARPSRTPPDRPAKLPVRRGDHWPRRPLAPIGPVLFCGVASAAIVWVLRDLRARRSRQLSPWAWTRAARVRLLIIIAIVPLEVVMFRSGGIESTQNLIGVALVGWQWVLINRVLAGARPSPAQK